MNEIDKALAALRESRDALKAELEADVRWQHLQRVENAIVALGGASQIATPEGVLVSPSSLAVGRPLASDVEERGTNPLLLTIIGEDPDRLWRVEELVTEMNKRGWETDAANRRNALGTALLRVAKRGEIEKVGRGRYRAALARTAPSESDTPAPNEGALQEPQPEASEALPGSIRPEAPLWAKEAGMGG